MKLYGVFIGINTYQDADIPHLHFACADAKRFDQLAQKAFGKDEYQGILLLNQEATYRNILDAIGNEIASQATSEDIVLIHFSGHGSPEIGAGQHINQTSRYIIPYDAVYDNFYGTALQMEKGLKSILARLQARLILTVVDACFSGRAGGRTFAGPYLQKASTGMRSGPLTLQELDLGEGCFTLTACRDSEVAREDANLGHGILSYALFEVLTDPANQQQTIDFGILAYQVRQRVGELSQRKQHPCWTGYSDAGEFPRFLQK
ncbi:MAG: caspase family protein [Ktedonobacteraceae bacterium]